MDLTDPVLVIVTDFDVNSGELSSQMISRREAFRTSFREVPA